MRNGCNCPNYVLLHDNRCTNVFMYISSVRNNGIQTLSDHLDILSDLKYVVRVRHLDELLAPYFQHCMRMYMYSILTSGISFLKLSPLNCISVFWLVSSGYFFTASCQVVVLVNVKKLL